MIDSDCTGRRVFTTYYRRQCDRVPYDPHTTREKFSQTAVAARKKLEDLKDQKELDALDSI